MDNLKERAYESLDCFDKELWPYISYLLQDLWEIGSSSKKILEIIKRNNLYERKLKILDIGCGKGAITIPIAKELNAEVFGIDGIPDFIDAAKEKAQEYHVEKLCTFIVGDAAELIQSIRGFNFVLLAAVGQILGDVSQTLSRIECCLNDDGFVVLDDAFLPDSSGSNYSRCLRESEFYRQIKESNFYVVEQIIHQPDDAAANDEMIYSKIKGRVEELSLKYPERKKLFESYLAAQQQENQSIENDLKCVTVLLRKK